MNNLTKIIPKNNDKLLNKLKNAFTYTEQQLFVESFHMYLDNHQENDYIIDLDNVYKWIGFERKADCKKLLLKHFEENKDFKVVSQNDETATAIAVAVSSF